MRGLAVWVMASALLLAEAGSAFAHAALLGSDPQDGSVLPQTPAQAVLTFNEPVAPAVLRLVDADGSAVDLAGVRGGGSTVTVGLPPLARGTHALSWRVISADGHPVGGTIVFSVGAADGRVAAAAGTSPALAALIWATRLMLYAGLFLGVGGVFFESWFFHERSRPGGRAIDAALALGLAAAAVSPGLQGADLLGLDLFGVTAWRTWRAGADTTFSLTLAVAAAALLLALAARRFKTLAGSRALSLLALAGLGLALAASGHASDAEPHALTRPAVFLHTVCVAFWIGALVPLAGALRGRAPGAREALAGFSALIPVPLGLLVLAGATLATVQVGSMGALATTEYGRILLAKLALVAVLLGLGAWNRWRLTARAASGVERRALVRLVGFESLVAVLVLGLVAGWRFTPPPRALAAAAAAARPAHLHIHGEQAMADVTFAPGHAGPLSVSLSILDGEMGLLQAKAVTLALANPAAGIEPIRAEARHLDGAAWCIDRLTVPAPGLWSVHVAILVDDFTQIDLDDRIALP